jgi:ribose/xylose/arabinose/galactoside ABC-type transport system permease subunit
MKKLFLIRELSTIVILVLEVLFFTWWLWPEAGREHPFLNAANALLILKYSAIYGIAAIGAAIVIISGGIDLAPGAVMALAGVVGSQLFVVKGWSLGGSMWLGILIGLASGLLSAALIVLVRLPPFIATLGMMGITRGAAFILTEGQYFDVSSRLVGGWRPLGLPADWVSPIVMIVLALAFQVLMTTFQWGRAVFSIGGNETAALFSGIAVNRIKTSVLRPVRTARRRIRGGAGARSGPGQGRSCHRLRAGYHRLGGGRRRQPGGGRGSVLGAVLGTLIFGVLRNALPQIPGATFYDRLIVGLAVIVIVVVDQLLLKRQT